MTVAITSSAILTVSPLLLIVWTVLQKGLPGLSLNFFTKTLEGVDPSAGAEGR